MKKMFTPPALLNFAFVSFMSLAASAFATSAFAQDGKAGDVKAGEKKAAMCIGCHGIPGYQSSFPEVHKVPMISGQNAEYLVAALTAYKKGERNHPTMRGIAGSLTDKDMADLGAFYQQHTAGAEPVSIAPKKASEQVTALLNKANCASCHGENFSKPISPAYPKIAGQHPDYLYVALKSYKTDKKHVQVGRGNAIMAGMAGQYKPEELKLMADYIGSLPGDLRVVKQSPFR